MNKKVPAVSMDRISLSPYEAQVAARLQYVVAQLATSHAGAKEEDVARILAERLRGLGVSPNPREVHLIAQSIAQMPQVPKTDRPAGRRVRSSDVHP
ncbi:hypothetical protein HC028_02640 [Planosporangium flavigriseum]|uniref:Uncharacterized protein n=1 Tax=Planosporangium flavigriseum TaxID=373681 RepID=A0A8J3M090_9ACTN|nr:hypothetical protein [Planosporangium flavigriseum]NJC63412.1 hypothetical protein [Planosporangium flavigriseum]GIG76716.1 hypothetical protein Pfl04_51200 [Planosporangium flavigriseum]